MNWHRWSADLDRIRMDRQLLYREIEFESGVPGTICNRAMHGCPVEFPAFEKLCVWANLNPLDCLEGGLKWKK